MAAVRLITKSEMEKRLRRYGCKFVESHPSGFEIWETGWQEPFTLWSENDRYDEWQYFNLLGKVIAQTMPSDWNSTGD
jgi:hypothetical protein